MINNYPTEITPEVLEKAKNVSNDQVFADLCGASQDLEKNKKLVESYKLQAEAYKVGTTSWRIACFRRDGYGYAVQKSEEEVTFLKALLEARGFEIIKGKIRLKKG